MVNSKTIDIHGPLIGEIEVPGDKSMTHRAIMLSSLELVSQQFISHY